MSFSEDFRVSQTKVKIFAEVAGDPNPIHQNAEVAKEMGLTGPIAHGMFVYSYLLRRLDDYLVSLRDEGKHWQLAHTRCRFHGVVSVGQHFKSEVNVLEKTEATMKLELQLLSATGERLTYVVATVNRV